jgi:hypothetical protein
MTVLAAPDPLQETPISPELVLISSPEVARFARSLLSTQPVPAPVEGDLQPRQLQLAVIWLICIAMTLGPLVFILIARP